MSHLCILSPVDPEFHLHIGGLLNPIPGSVITCCCFRPFRNESFRSNGFLFSCCYSPVVPSSVFACCLTPRVAVCGPDCQFELSGADGLIRSSQVEEENKVKPDQAVDCIWTVRAPPNHRVCTTRKVLHVLINDSGTAGATLIPMEHTLKKEKVELSGRM